MAWSIQGYEADLDEEEDTGDDWDWWEARAEQMDQEAQVDLTTEEELTDTEEDVGITIGFRASEWQELPTSDPYEFADALYELDDVSRNDVENSIIMDYGGVYEFFQQVFAMTDTHITNFIRYVTYERGYMN